MTPGYIYVLSNPSMPGLLKIGRSKNGAKARAKELNTTGVPEPFEILGEAYICDMITTERNIHELLKEYRYNSSREFFKLTYKVCCELINNKYPDIIISEPNENNISSEDYENELRQIKRKKDSFILFAEENNWFLHRDCFEGHNKTRRDFEVNILQVFNYIEEGLSWKQIAIDKAAYYVEEDKKYIKSQLDELNEKINYYWNKYRNWKKYNGPCICKKCSKETDKKR